MKIVGYGVCGNNQPHIKKTLDTFKRLCDETIICGNNIGKKERHLIHSYGFRLVEDNREWGYNQHIIKEDLLKNEVSQLKPDICICLDMDEEIDPSFTRKEALKYGKIYYGAYFYFVQHWDSDETQNLDFNFWNVRMFKWNGDTQFENKPLHCGLAPKFAYTHGSFLPHYVRHYGLMDKKDREVKIARYKKYDPNNTYKAGWIQKLQSSSKRTPFEHEITLKELQKEVEKYGNQIKKIDTMLPKKYFRVRRTVGDKSDILDIPENQLDETLNRSEKNGGPKFELVSSEPIIVGGVAIKTTITENKGVGYKPDEEKKEENICGECGFLAKSKAGLTRHAKTHE